MMQLVIFTYLMVTMLLVLAGIAFVAEAMRREYCRSGNWAYNTASLMFIVWCAVGLAIVGNI